MSTEMLEWTTKETLDIQLSRCCCLNVCKTTLMTDQPAPSWSTWLIHWFFDTSTNSPHNQRKLIPLHKAIRWITLARFKTSLLLLSLKRETFMTLFSLKIYLLNTYSPSIRPQAILLLKMFQSLSNSFITKDHNKNNNLVQPSTSILTYSN